MGFSNPVSRVLTRALILSAAYALLYLTHEISWQISDDGPTRCLKAGLAISYITSIWTFVISWVPRPSHESEHSAQETPDAFLDAISMAYLLLALALAPMVLDMLQL